jgi:hypothetical protein
MVNDCENIIEMDCRKINCLWWKRVRFLSISILLFMKNKNIIIMYCAYLNSTSIKKMHANKITVYHNRVYYFPNMFLSTSHASFNLTSIYCRQKFIVTQLITLLISQCEE